MSVTDATRIAPCATPAATTTVSVLRHRRSVRPGRFPRCRCRSRSTAAGSRWQRYAAATRASRAPTKERIDVQHADVDGSASALDASTAIAPSSVAAGLCKTHLTTRVARLTTTVTVQSRTRRADGGHYRPSR